MANEKISEYVNEVVTLADTDLFDVSEDLGGGSWESKRLTWANLKANMPTLYLNNGSLDENRTVTLGIFSLTFGNNILFLDDSPDFVGIGTAAQSGDGELLNIGQGTGVNNFKFVSATNPTFIINGADFSIVEFRDSGTLIAKILGIGAGSLGGRENTLELSVDLTNSQEAVQIVDNNGGTPIKKFRFDVNLDFVGILKFTQDGAEVLGVNGETRITGAGNTNATLTFLLDNSDNSTIFEVNDGQEIGAFGATPVAQPSSTGETVGFTAGVGTGVNDDSTFTGNVGATAYRISDIVKHLKNLGWIAS